MLDSRKRRTADEIMKPARGRTPSKKGIEKRVEAALTQPDEPKKKPKTFRNPKGAGRPKITYDERPEHIRYILDCCAMGYSSKRIVAMLQERFGEKADEVVTASTIQSYRKRYAGEIAQRERDLRSEIPGMLPSQRMRYLQRVIDDASEGIVLGLDRQGEPIIKKDHALVISAVKEMNSMQRDLDSQKVPENEGTRLEREIAEQKDLIRVYVADKKDQSGKSEAEILDELSKTDLGADYKDAIAELKLEYH